MKKNIVLLLIVIFVLVGCAKKQPTYTDTVVMLDGSQNSSYEVKLRTYDWLNYYMDEYEYDDKTILTIKYNHNINESKYSVVKERMDQFAENEVLELIETYKASSLVLDDMGMKYMMKSQELENQELKVTIDYRNNYSEDDIPENVSCEIYSYDMNSLKWVYSYSCGIEKGK